MRWIKLLSVTEVNKFLSHPPTPPPFFQNFRSTCRRRPLLHGWKVNYSTRNMAKNYTLKVCVSVCECVWFCAYALSGCISNVRNARGHSWVFLMRLSIYHYSNEFKGEWFIVCVCACRTIDIIITIITINY